ncbi:MAG: alpha/beta hydrolase [Candidatus Hodarchaeota archaeon]
MVSKQMKFIIKGLLHSRDLANKKRVEDQRRATELLAVGVKLPEDVTSNSIDIDGVSSMWFKTPNAHEDKVVLFLHGGSYIAGSIDISKYHAVYISRVSNTQLLGINYRLAPEHPFPAALDDAVKVYKWLIKERGFSSEKIAIVGVSAGGGLAIATLLKLRDLGLELPLAAVCISPWVDLAFTGETFKTRAKLDPLTTPDGLEFAASLYIGDNNPKNPYISPVYANLNNLPPLYIMAGTDEVLYDDSVRLAENAIAVGLDATLDIWEDMIHGFPVFASVVPESREAIEKVGKFLRKHFNQL